MPSFGQIRKDEKLAESQAAEKRRTLPILKRCCECGEIIGLGRSAIQYAGRKRTKRICWPCTGWPVPENPGAC